MVGPVLSDCGERLVDHRLGQGPVVVRACHDLPSPHWTAPPRMLTTFI